MEFENLAESGNFELKTRKYTSKKFSRPKKLGTWSLGLHWTSKFIENPQLQTHGLEKFWPNHFEKTFYPIN